MALIPFTKPHLSIPEQIALLRARGMVIDDDALATRCLQRFGYYRLSGYWHPMRQSRILADQNGKRTEILDNFRPGARLSHAVDLCVFDKRLKLLMTDGIERIEVALRVDIAHLLGARDPWAHQNPGELHGNFSRVRADGGSNHQDWLERLGTVEARSKEDYVKHFKDRYSSPLPIWMSIELWEFGTLSVFLSGLKVSDQQTLAAIYGLPRWELLSSWARSLNHVRNICAHHSRLWNRSPSDQPKPTRVGEIPVLDHLAQNAIAQTRLYGVAAITQALLRSISPNSNWHERLKALVATFPVAPGVTFQPTGFPVGWENLPLWQPLAAPVVVAEDPDVEAEQDGEV